MSAFRPSRHWAAQQDSIAIGAQETLPGRQAHSDLWVYGLVWFSAFEGGRGNASDANLKAQRRLKDRMENFRTEGSVRSLDQVCRKG